MYGGVFMRLQESGEMYLETIYVLSKEKPLVRSIDVSEHLGYSKPSVSRAVNLLKNGGFITVEDSGALILTEEGHQIASMMFERHTILSRCLIKLGVSAETATEDACKIEHVISEESFEAIKKFISP